MDRIACEKFRSLNEAFLDGAAALIDCVDPAGVEHPVVCSVRTYDHDEYGEVTVMLALAYVIDGRGWMPPELEEAFPGIQA